ncbi:MAG: PLP-dependent transferase, partial [Burkholderiaceae bacterium]|nr:PLP-dependent transferase [Burkholderiaceae bacterium]
MKNKKSVATRLNHSDYVAPGGFGAFPVPIHHASTVLFENVAAMRTTVWQDKTGYTYGLHGTPTTFTLEARLAEIEGGQHCLLAPSGLAAITIVNFGLLSTGDDVLLPDNVYGPNREMGQWLSKDFGISARFYDPLIGTGIAELIQPNTKLIWAETPGSVSMEVPDIPAICRAAHERGVLVALDNTWSGGILFRAFEHGADISLQALTKYQSGGSDVLMGAVITRNEAIYRRLCSAHARLGMGVGADDVYLVLRGLQSMKARLDAHDAAARTVASWLKTRPEIAQVLPPA